MYEFASVSRTEKVEILQRTKRGLHGAQSAFYYDRSPMLSTQFAQRQEILCLTEHGATFSSIKFLRRT